MNRLAAFVLFAGLASGCALTETTVHLDYTAASNAMQIPGVEAVVATVIVHDLRPDRTRVSSKKNGFGMEMAAIRSDRRSRWWWKRPS